MNPPSNSSDWLPCKNKNSYRKVEMPQNLAELLQEFWQYQQKNASFIKLKIHVNKFSLIGKKVPVTTERPILRLKKFL